MGLKMRNYRVKEYKKDIPTDIRKAQMVVNIDTAGLFIRYKGVDIFLYVGSYEGMDEFVKELGRRWRALKRKQPEIAKEVLVAEAESIMLGGKG